MRQSIGWLTDESRIASNINIEGLNLNERIHRS